jgi:hypothetical protein
MIIPYLDFDNLTHRGSMSPQVHLESSRISRLHKNSAGSCEFTDKTFSRSDAGDDTTARDSFKHVVAIPSHKMPVVDHVPLVVL